MSWRLFSGCHLSLSQSLSVKEGTFKINKVDLKYFTWGESKKYKSQKFSMFLKLIVDRIATIAFSALYLKFIMICYLFALWSLIGGGGYPHNGCDWTDTWSSKSASLYTRELTLQAIIIVWGPIIVALLTAAFYF